MLRWGDYYRSEDAAHDVVREIEARGGGRVINILTNLITFPVVQYHSYTTAKSAMLGFSRNLAAELGPENIAVDGGLTMH